MSTAISIKSNLCPASGLVRLFDWRNSAMSDEAQVLERETQALTQAFDRSEALFGAKSVAIEDLRLMAEECKEEDWDGYGASPTDAQALVWAERFVRVLPDEIPLPEIAPEPDGSISLDWARSRSQVFSVSIGAHKRVAYAWLRGTDKSYGVEAFDGVRIPRILIDGIQKIMGGR